MATSENTMTNVPNWSRPGLGGRGRSFYPKQLPRDKLKPLATSPSAFLSSNRKMDSATLIASARTADRQTIVQMIEEARKRIVQQEKDITFLTTQHKDVLKSLHEEIGRLKAENKDLQFELIMSKDSGDKEAEKGRKSDRASAKDDNETLFLENELHDLRAALKEELERNSLLAKQVNQKQEDQQHEQEGQQAYMSFLPHPVRPTVADSPVVLPPLSSSGLSQNYYSSHSSSAQSHPPRPSFVPSYTMEASTVGYGTSLKILRPGELPRPPTLGECEVIIQNYHHVTERQKHELESVKSDLQDILYSSKWTPDAFLQAKRYLKRETTESDQKERMRMLPHSVPLKDSSSLPPLKPNLENRAVERQKRQQAVHKERFRREVLH